jgi:hypothetical protein
MVRFGGDGQPVEAADEKDPEMRVLWNGDLMACPERCFRPAGVAVGQEGEVFVTGDSTGDLWVVKRTGENAGGGAEGQGESGGSGSGNVNGESAAMRGGNCSPVLVVGLMCVALWNGVF